MANEWSYKTNYCTVKLWKIVSETLKTWESNIFIDWNDISFGCSDLMNIMQNGTPKPTPPTRKSLFSTFLSEYLKVS